MVSLLEEKQVKDELMKLKIPFKSIEDGMVELLKHLSPKKHLKLKKNLLIHGLELQEANKVLLVERIKDTFQKMLRFSDGMPEMNYSIYLSLNLRYDYTYLANVFSEVCGNSIQHYFIESKIERVKELFLISNLNLSEISYLLNYSSVAHLSGQFKKITGLSPSCYKLITQPKEKLEELA